MQYEVQFSGLSLIGLVGSANKLIFAEPFKVCGMWVSFKNVSFIFIMTFLQFSLSVLAMIFIQCKFVVMITEKKKNAENPSITYEGLEDLAPISSPASFISSNFSRIKAPWT